MDDESRFSVFVLEKDVLEYNHFKAKYEEFDALSKTKIKGFLYKNYYKDQKMFWYNKYIKKMSYLEKRYRKTNVYTKYHEQMETPYLLDQEPVVATLIEPSAPPHSNEL
jgi:hypothetical protein